LNDVDKAGTVPRIDFTTHISAATRQLVSSRDWLHVIQPPAYARDLNPTEGVWSHVKRSLGNLAAIVRNRLKGIQYRPDLLTGSSPRPDSPSTRSRRNPDHSTSVSATACT
jgi:transposase